MLYRLRMTRLTASDGHQLDAYEVHPEGAAASIVIVQEIFGVNAHIRSVVDRYAEFGYRAIAPALFDRGETGVELGYDDEGASGASSWRCRSHSTRRCSTSPLRSTTSPRPDRWP